MEIQLRFHGYSTGIELDLPSRLSIVRNPTVILEPPVQSLSSVYDV